MSLAKVTLHRIALQCAPKRFGRSVVTNNLADLLYTRFEELGRISDLDEALVLYRSALESRPQDRARLLGNIANCLHARAVQFGTLSELHEALTLYRETLELLPKGDPDRALSLAGIASCFYTRFVQLGMLVDLDEAIATQRDALELRPQGHPDRPLSLGVITDCLHLRFRHRGTLSDLDEALALGRGALELRPQGHPLRARSLCDIAQYLHSRFTQFGALSDLDEAIALEREVLDLCPKGYADRAVSLSNLANSLHARFTQLGTVSDLDEALTLERHALGLRPKGHPQHALSLGNIANHLHARFIQLGTPSDLDEALALQHDALELHPEGHPYCALSLDTIAGYHYTRFKHLGTLADLDSALALYRDTLALFPQEHPHRPLSLVNIARCLHTRSTQLGTVSDLDEAVALARSALQLYPQGHPNRASSLGILAQSLHARFKLMRDRKDLEETFTLYTQLADVPQAVSFADLECANQWIQAAEECQHGTTVLAYQTFLRFSTHHLATLLSLPHDVAQLKKLTASTAADAVSACVRHGDLINAVELLEQGRDLFWSQILRLRSPLDEVIASGDTAKESADSFTRLTSVLRTVLETPIDAESHPDRASPLNVKLQDVVADIRKLPGLSGFLQTPRFSNLQIAAAGGPVIVVNASQYGCDALIVLSDRDPIHVALPITKAHVSELSSEFHALTSPPKSEHVTNDMLVLLRQLWDAIMSPIVEVLEQVCPHGSRIWWCPTAEFSLLPLHAARAYREDQSNLFDLYISSYTPTLGALIRAREKVDASIDSHRLSFVGKAQENEPVSVNTELSTISQRLGSATSITYVQGKDVNAAKVAEELAKSEWVHFACQGVTNWNQPFESGFALNDGLFKVEDLVRCDMQRAPCAYVSTCHMTDGGKSPSLGADASLPLAAAMQFAGFGSVVGPMWAVDDAYAHEMTSRFYKTLVDGSGRLDRARAAWAVHETMKGVHLSEIPLDQQIVYMHVGA